MDNIKLGLRQKKTLLNNVKKVRSFSQIILWSHIFLNHFAIDIFDLFQAQGQKIEKNQFQFFLNVNLKADICKI